MSVGVVIDATGSMDKVLVAMRNITGRITVRYTRRNRTVRFVWFQDPEVGEPNITTDAGGPLRFRRGRVQRAAPAAGDPPEGRREEGARQHSARQRKRLRETFSIQLESALSAATADGGAADT